VKSKNVSGFAVSLHTQGEEARVSGWMEFRLKERG